MQKKGKGGDINRSENPKKLTPKQWKEKNLREGNLPVNGPRQAVHPEYYNPNKWYQDIDDKGNIIDKPYISYTDPTKPVPVDPEHKSLDLSNPSFKYDPNLGRYFNPVTGDEIKPIVEQYKKGGKVKGYNSGGGVSSASVNEFGGNAYNQSFSSANSNPKKKYVEQNNGSTKNAQTAQMLGGATLAIGNTMYDKANPNRTPEDKATTNAIDGVASVATPWYGIAKGVSNMGRSQLKRDEYGNVTGNVNRAADEFMAPQHENALEAYKREGAGGALKEFFTPAALMRGGADLIGKGDETKGFWGGINNFSGNTSKNKERNAAKLADEQFALDSEAFRLAEEKRIKEIERAANIDEAILKRNGNFKDGGEIKGKGTGTSDSITAKVEAGSFIVPAAQSAAAKLIRKQILGKAPNKTANINQAGGEDVRLSAGEILFTPDEVKEITAAGINLDALAPESKSKLKTHMMACGGKVMGYKAGGEIMDTSKLSGDDKDFVKSEKEKIAAERKADAKKYGEARARQLAEAKTRELNANIRKLLSEQLSQKKEAQKMVEKSKAELDALKQSYKIYDEQSSMELNRDLTSGEKLVGASSKPASEDVRKNKEDLLNKIKEKETELTLAQNKFDYANNERNYINETSLGVAKPKGELAKNPYKVPTTTETVVTENVTEQPSAGEKATASASKRPAAPATATVVNETPDVLQSKFINELPTNTTEPQLRGATALGEAPAIVDVNTTTGSGQTQRTGGKGMGFDAGAAFGTALTYGIPLAQTLIGLNQLKKAGDRPVDRIDQDVYDAVNKTKQNALKAEEQAKFGMSAAESSALRMQNNALTNSSRYAARNLSGGSSGNAIALERAAINDSFGRSLSARVYDNNLKQQKQQVAYEMQDRVNNAVNHKQELNRRLFSDTMSGWMQKQQAGSNLLGAGINNLVGANRYEQEKKASQERNNAYNYWNNV